MGRRNYTEYILTCLLVMWVLSSCSAPWDALGQDPDSTKSPPIYPKAYQIDRTTLENGESIPVHVVTFYTQDTPDEVLTFYKDTLAKDGWSLDSSLSTANDLRFTWERGTSFYHLDVIVEVETGKGTRVVVRLATYVEG
jgi:hypothetical protein